MRRYLIWSTGFHVLLLAGGAVIAPLSGLGGDYSPTTVVTVGLVDFADPGRARGGSKPKAPEPARDEIIAARPDQKLEPEKVKEKPKPKEESKTAKNAASSAKKDTAKTQTEFASRDDSISGTLGEGEGGGDIWGVETGANVNPYHRQGFASIRSNWRNPVVGGIPRKCVLKFKVKRNGQITDIELEKESGSELFDRAALRAVQVTASWPAFPEQWKEDEQLIHLEFEYRP